MGPGDRVDLGTILFALLILAPILIILTLLVLSPLIGGAPLDISPRA